MPTIEDLLRRRRPKEPRPEEELSPLERYYQTGRVPTPTIVQPPVPPIVEYQQAPRTIPQTPIERYQATERAPTPPIREYYYTGRQLPEPAQPRLPFEAFAPLPTRRWINPTPGVYSGGPPTAPYIEREREISRQAGSLVTSLLSGRVQKKAIGQFVDMLGMFPKQFRTPAEAPDTGWDPSGIFRWAEMITKKAIAPFTRQYAYTIGAPPLYAPGDYTPTYAGEDGISVRIPVGSRGTPGSSRRSYGTSLINWRV